MGNLFKKKVMVSGSFYDMSQKDIRKMLKSDGLMIRYLTFGLKKIN